MKTILLLFASMMMLSMPALSQETPQNFNKLRDNDFKKLIGGIQEGVRINYNTEKANIEGSVATHIKKQKQPTPFLLQFTGSVGTTTNLSKLFGSDLLPTYSGAVTLHSRVPWGVSMYYYDGPFNAIIPNEDHPQNPTIATQLKDTSIALARISELARNKFYYQQKARDRAIAGELEPEKKKLYSFKRIFWTSLQAKHDYAKYAFFDPSSAFTAQLTNPQYRTYSIKGILNFFGSWNKEDIRWKRYRPDFFYLTLSIGRGLGNNVSSLQKKTINTVSSQVVDTISGVIRQQVESQTAYDGVYRQYGTTTLSFEGIIAPFSVVALFANAELAVIDKKKRDEFTLSNSSTFATGIYFYSGGNNSINIGVFYKWVQDSSTQDWVGSLNLRTSIPISPL